MRAILLATRDQLRTSLSIGEDLCEVMPDGRPPPWAGEYFYAIYPTEWSSQSELNLDEFLGVGVTLTIRHQGTVPYDKVGLQIITKQTTGLYARSEKVRRLLHLNYSVMQTANTTITADAILDGLTGANGFYTALLFGGGGGPEPKSASWWLGESKTGKECGWAMSLRFRLGRLQKIEEAF